MIRIKNSVGDKLLDVTIEIPPPSKEADPKQTPVNLEKFLLGKWTWLVDDGCFSLCQEVTQQERADFNNFIASSRFSYEKIYHMPISEFIKAAIASSQIDWVPATHHIIESIAKHPTTVRTKKYRDQLERLINLDHTEIYSASLHRIKIPKDIEALYHQHLDIEETHIEHSTTIEIPSELTTAAQDSEYSEEESPTHTDPDLKNPHEGVSKSPETELHAEGTKKRTHTKNKLNAVQKYIENYLKDEPNANSADIWNAIKDGKAEGLEIDSNRNILQYRTISFSPKYKGEDGKNLYAQKKYTPEEFKIATNEIKDTLKK